MSYCEEVFMENESDRQSNFFQEQGVKDLPSITTVGASYWIPDAKSDSISSWHSTPFPPHVEAVGCALPDLRYVIYAGAVAAGALEIGRREAPAIARRCLAT